LAQEGLSPIGLDISQSLLSEASRHAPVLPGSLDRIPLPDGETDGVLCECALSLCQDPEKALKEFSRILKSGGAFVLSDMFLKERALGAFALRPPRIYGGHDGALSRPGLCQERALSRPALERWLFQVGLKPFHYEDRLCDLKNLAARLVWSLGSRAKLCQFLSGGGADEPIPQGPLEGLPEEASASLEDLPGPSPGRLTYALLLARKE
jgi:SAM-dependent methyltransferase